MSNQFSAQLLRDLLAGTDVQNLVDYDLLEKRAGGVVSLVIATKTLQPIEAGALRCLVPISSGEGLSEKGVGDLATLRGFSHRVRGTSRP